LWDEETFLFSEDKKLNTEKQGKTGLTCSDCTGTWRRVMIKVMEFKNL